MNDPVTERFRERQIRQLAGAHHLGALGEEHITKGTSYPKFRELTHEHLLDSGSRKPLEPERGFIGLTDKQARAFSLTRAIAGVMDVAQREKAAFEMSVIGETRDQLSGHGVECKGQIVLPVEVLRNQIAPWLDPDFAVRTLTAGGIGANLVQTTVLEKQYIRPNYIVPRVIEAGASVITGLVGNVKIPKMSAGSTATWVAAENNALSNTDPTFAQVSLSPHDVGVYVDVSRRLVLQSTPGADALVAADLSRQIAIAVDAAALNGTGASGQPTGLLNVGGIGSNPVGTNGGPLTWPLVTTSVQTVAAQNLLSGALGWISSAQGKMHCTRTVKVASYPEYLCDSPNFSTMAGYPVYVDNNVPINLAKGTGTNLTQMWFGAWDYLVIGYWGNGLDLLIDPYTFSNTGAVRIRAMATVDIAPRFAAAFCLTGDVNPT